MSDSERVAALRALLSEAKSASALSALAAAWRQESAPLHEAVRVFWAARPLQQDLRAAFELGGESEEVHAMLLCSHEDLVECSAFPLVTLVSPLLSELSPLLARPSQCVALFEAQSAQPSPTHSAAPSLVLDADVERQVGAVGSNALSALSEAKRLLELRFLASLALIWTSALDDAQ